MVCGEPWFYGHGSSYAYTFEENIMSKKNKKIALENLGGFEWGGYERKTLIPTGHAELDYYLACGLMENEEFSKFDETKSGGIPLGCICMIYGGPGGGKSSLAYRICGYAQRLGLTPVWFDVENSFSEGLARINGADISKMGRMRMYDKEHPEVVFYAEKIMDSVAETIKAGADVIVIDSIAALVTKAELENSVEKDTMAALARVLGKSIPAINSLAAANDCLVLAINQLREKPGVSFGNPEGTKGGNTLRHQSSIILKVNKLNSQDSLIYIEGEDGEDELIAGSANAWIEKNRFSMPHKKGIRMPVYYKSYFPDIEEIIFNTGRQVRVINKRKTTFSWGDVKIEGRKEFIEHLTTIDLNILIEDIKEAATERGTPLPPEIINYESHKKFESIKSKGKNDSDDSEAKPSRKRIIKKKEDKETSVSVPDVPQEL